MVADHGLKAPVPREMSRRWRTETIIAKFKGNADEFAMLKGVLCMGHGLNPDDYKLAYELFDGRMIADRMDALNAEAAAEWAAKKGAAT